MIRETHEQLTCKKDCTRQELVKRINIVKDHINQYSANSLLIEQLGDLAAMNSFYLIRVFKQYVGITPHRYLVHKRIENAKQLLAEGHSVTDICKLVGFEDISSFSKLFKRNTGLSPREFRSEINKPTNII